MYDDIIRWMQSPTMLFSLILVAGSLGYLKATNNLHYISNAYNSALFIWKNILKDTLQKPINDDPKNDPAKPTQ